MRTKILILLTIITVFSNTLSASKIVTNSVVKVFSTLSIPNYKEPWQKNKLSKYVGSGAIISDNRILTSAHVVSDAKFIEIKKETSEEKFIAKIKYISHQADLAILEVLDKDFFIDTKPLKLNEDIEIRDEVTVLGYPLGGNNISSTSGIISRIEYTKYIWSKKELLSIQIDAAINNGNSGGPAINNNGELIGIAMQRLLKTQNIGYLVPSIVINTFLEDIEDGIVDGFYSGNTQLVKMENKTMREFYGLDKINGVLINYVSPSETILNKDDILLSIDGYDIYNNGKIDTKLGKLNLMYAFHKKQIGKKVKLKVFRNKKVVELFYTLKRIKPIINTEYNVKPRYYIYGGFVFTPLTQNLLKTFSLPKGSMDLLFYKEKDRTKFDEPVICMKSKFPHPINRGYIPNSEIVYSVNNIKVKNLNHFINIVEKSDNEFIIIDFFESNSKIILKSSEVKQSFNELKKYFNNSISNLSRY